MEPSLLAAYSWTRFVSCSSIRPDAESGLATKEGGALTHFTCLQEGIFLNAGLHDAPSFVPLINCDSSPTEGKDSLQKQDHHSPECVWHFCLKCRFPDMLSSSWPSPFVQKQKVANQTLWVQVHKHVIKPALQPNYGSSTPDYRLQQSITRTSHHLRKLLIVQTH